MSCHASLSCQMTKEARLRIFLLSLTMFTGKDYLRHYLLYIVDFCFVLPWRNAKLKISSMVSTMLKGEY